jgi:hypothetical protein
LARRVIDEINIYAEAGTGGNLTWFSGSISISSGKQVYDFTDTNYVSVETGSFTNDIFTIRRIFHNPFPAINRVCYIHYWIKGL